MSDHRRDAVVTIAHPGYVHLFRHAITELEDRGFDVHVFAREKHETRELLEGFDIDHELLAGSAHTLPQLIRVQAKYEYEILKRTRRMDSPVLLAAAEPAITHASTCFDCHSLLFLDTEHDTLQNVLANPFADVICTPESYWDELGSKQVRYPGNHQLAYLHPDRFEPDPTVLDAVDADKDDQIVLMRLVEWESAHDRGHGGIGQVKPVVEGLERAGATVLITSEVELPDSLGDRTLDLASHRIHDLMYYSDLYLGEGLTMANESAVLGTPAIYISSLWTGISEELSREYGLLFRYGKHPHSGTVLDQAMSILEVPQATWDSRRESLLEEKIDTTAFIVRAVETIDRT